LVKERRGYKETGIRKLEENLGLNIVLISIDNLQGNFIIEEDKPPEEITKKRKYKLRRDKTISLDGRIYYIYYEVI